MHTYKTDYPNQVHQLLVSVSKHLYVKQDGGLGWQKKSFEVSLKSLRKSKRNHVIHYLLRDHFTGTFYGEVACSENIMDAMGFLHRAWSQKEQHPFCGVPNAITIPSTVSDMFPATVHLVEALGIHRIKATSGFQAGVRDLRTWEELIRAHPRLYEAENTFQNLQNNTCGFSIEICTSSDDRKNKLKIWAKGVDTLYVPPPLKEFHNL